MRCDQFAGLPEAANAFLCGNELEAGRRLIGHFQGMFGHTYDLYRHQLDDGYADEFVQADPWSSGPVFFLGLRVYNAEGVVQLEFLWPQEFIDNA